MTATARHSSHAFQQVINALIILVGVLPVAIVCPARAESESPHAPSANESQSPLLGKWARQKKGTDGQGSCLIDIAVEFQPDSRFLYRRTFHAVDHQRPTWDSLLNSGTWMIRNGILIQHWDSTGESPGGYTTRSALLGLSTSQFRCTEGVDGAVSYHRPSGQVLMERRTQRRHASFL
jgi:hypothetical protein